MLNPLDVAIDGTGRPIVTGYATSSELIVGTYIITMGGNGNKWWMTGPSLPMVRLISTVLR